MVVGLRGLAYLGAILIAGRAPAVSLAIYGLIPLIYLAVLAVKHDPLPADAARDIA